MDAGLAARSSRQAAAQEPRQEADRSAEKTGRRLSAAGAAWQRDRFTEARRCRVLQLERVSNSVANHQSRTEAPIGFCDIAAGDPLGPHDLIELKISSRLSWKLHSLPARGSRGKQAQRPRAEALSVGDKRH